MLRVRIFVLLVLMINLPVIWAGPDAIIDTYKIADPVGDWGFPTPFGMYPRGPGYVRMSFIFDTLLWKDRTGIVPALARKWQYLEKENAYVFVLHKNITWHDGQPLKADDIIFTFQYIKEHPWPWFNPAMIAGIDKLDQWTVRIRLKYPYAPFLNNGACTVPILPRHIWAEVKHPESFKSKKALVGSGPFQLLDYNKSRGSYLYEANEGYYGGTLAVRRLIFIKAGTSTAPVMLEKNMIQACPLPGEWLRDFQNKGFHVETQPCAWVTKLAVNHHHPLLGLVQVRRALAFALDREKIVTIITRGHGIPGNPGLIPPDHTPWYNPHCRRYPYEQKTVKKLLQSTGYTQGGDGFYYKGGKKLQFDLLVGTATRPEFARLAEFIKIELEELGIAIHIRSLEAKTVDTLILNWKFQLALQGHGGLGADPDIFSKVVSFNGFNSARFYKNKELSQLLDLQLHQRDTRKRQQTVWRIQKIYAAELPAISLYYPRVYWAHEGSIKLYYTPGGLASGIPIALNKLAFVNSPHKATESK